MSAFTDLPFHNVATLLALPACMLVLAPAASGKTSFLVNRIETLKRVSPITPYVVDLDSLSTRWDIDGVQQFALSRSRLRNFRHVNAQKWAHNQHFTAAGVFSGPSELVYLADALYIETVVVLDVGFDRIAAAELVRNQPDYPLATPESHAEELNRMARGAALLALRGIYCCRTDSTGPLIAPDHPERKGRGSLHLHEGNDLSIWQGWTADAEALQVDSPFEQLTAASHLRLHAVRMSFTHTNHGLNT